MQRETPATPQRKVEYAAGSADLAARALPRDPTVQLAATNEGWLEAVQPVLKQRRLDGPLVLVVAEDVSVLNLPGDDASDADVSLWVGKIEELRQAVREKQREPPLDCPVPIPATVKVGGGTVMEWRRKAADQSMRTVWLVIDMIKIRPQEVHDSFKNLNVFLFDAQARNKINFMDPERMEGLKNFEMAIRGAMDLTARYALQLVVPGAIKTFQFSANNRRIVEEIKKAFEPLSSEGLSTLRRKFADPEEGPKSRTPQDPPTTVADIVDVDVQLSRIGQRTYRGLRIQLRKLRIRGDDQGTDPVVGHLAIRLRSSRLSGANAEVMGATTHFLFAMPEKAINLPVTIVVYHNNNRREPSELVPLAPVEGVIGRGPDRQYVAYYDYLHLISAASFYGRAFKYDKETVRILASRFHLLTVERTSAVDIISQRIALVRQDSSKFLDYQARGHSYRMRPPDALPMISIPLAVTEDVALHELHGISPDIANVVGMTYLTASLKQRHEPLDLDLGDINLEDLRAAFASIREEQPPEESEEELDTVVSQQESIAWIEEVLVDLESGGQEEEETLQELGQEELFSS